jgi:C-terminal processing protease CtpA/Prc
MVAAFASENGVATLVGTKTGGRLVAASAHKVGEGYRVVLPAAAFFTWAGTNLDGRGVEPNHSEPFRSTVFGQVTTTRWLPPNRSCLSRLSAERGPEPIP